MDYAKSCIKLKINVVEKAHRAQSDRKNCVRTICRLEKHVQFNKKSSIFILFVS